MSKALKHRIALLQHHCPADGESKVLKMLDMAGEAVKQDARLIVTQELFHCSYFPQNENEKAFDHALEIPSPVTEEISEFCREHKVALMASLFEKRSSAIYHNSALMFNAKGEIQTHYRKTHIPDDPGFYEKYYFRPGDRGYQVAKLRGGLKAGMLICWDQWFPEAARLTAMKDAEILVYPSAIGHPEADGHMLEPEDEVKANQEAWRTMLRSHAIANGVFVAAVNRVGLEGELRFWGGSLVIDPLGRVISEASPSEEEILITDLDLALMDHSRRTWPFFRDRRSETYSGLLKAWLG